MKTVLKSILFAFMIGSATLGPALAYASEGAKPAVQPRNDLDNWDDDVWADWGAQPSTNTKEGNGYDAPATPEAGKDSTPGASAGFGGGGAFGGGAASSGPNGFGESSDKIRFRLVREGYNDEPKGVRKFRPNYGKKKSL